jgi:hypothetical protein
MLRYVPMPLDRADQGVIELISEQLPQFSALLGILHFTAVSTILKYVCTLRRQMEQGAAARFLTLKGLNPSLIHLKLESVYHEDALSPPTL